MHFFITAIKIFILVFAPLKRAKRFFSVDSLKELGGQPNPRVGGYCHMGYTMQRFIGYGFRACS